ncbi:MAG: glycosyltransferase family 4 protein [Acidobacteria bacterium]|nr:glycosyltransferase family 4 protein [Acidobacteriota bacterium]
MRVLVVHESYQNPGGEDLSTGEEILLLRSHGHEVIEYRRHNRDVARYGAIALGMTTIWSPRSYRDIFDLVRRERPGIVHFNNTFPLISPSAFWAAKRAGAGVVLTLHNFRLACPNALLYRGGGVCEDCIGWTLPLPGIVRGCYRGSRPASLAAGAMLAAHRALGTWRRVVDRFIALSSFQRAKLVTAGLPEDRVVVRPNFLSRDPGMGPGDGGFGLFVGRLVAAKGIRTLLEAWNRYSPGMPLKVVGDGPLAKEVARAAAGNAAVEHLGPRPGEHVTALMQRAAFLVFASECYEGLGRTIVEAFAAGLPVVASRVGSAAEVVVDGRTGLHFRPGDPADLAQAARRMVCDAARRETMRVRCRKEYVRRYSAEAAHSRLMEIYGEALENAPSGGMSR